MPSASRTGCCATNATSARCKRAAVICCSIRCATRRRSWRSEPCGRAANRAPDKREIALAEQLIGALEDHFDPKRVSRRVSASKSWRCSQPKRKAKSCVSRRRRKRKHTRFPRREPAGEPESAVGRRAPWPLSVDKARRIARAFWSGTMTFGLVSVPVDLFPAVRSRRAPLRMLGPGRPAARSAATIAPVDGEDAHERRHRARLRERRRQLHRSSPTRSSTRSRRASRATSTCALRRSARRSRGSCSSGRTSWRRPASRRRRITCSPKRWSAPAAPASRRSSCAARSTSRRSSPKAARCAP